MKLKKLVRYVLLICFIGINCMPIKVNADAKVSHVFSVLDLGVNSYDMCIRNLYKDNKVIRGSSSIYPALRKCIEWWDSKPGLFIRGIFCVPAILNCFAEKAEWITRSSSYLEITSTVPSIVGSVLFITELGAIVPSACFKWYKNTWKADAAKALTKEQHAIDEGYDNTRKWINQLGS